MSAASPNPTASADEVPPSAVALLQQAAGAGDAESMNQLGELYRQGRGVAQDDGQARDWYQRAAGAGNAAAMNSLGNLYYHGLGMARDYGQARRWYQKAAEAGNERAMNNLGNLYCKYSVNASVEKAA
jgi:TPR repeat protein